MLIILSGKLLQKEIEVCELLQRKARGGELN